MNSVIKGASYVLAHTPDMVLYNGTTQTTERIVNPDSEYLKEVPEHLRTYEDCVAYWPNQTYIGNVHPDELAQVEAPWYDKKMENASRYGKYGEIMPEEEFLFLVQISDQFEVVKLEKNFVEKYKGQFAANPIITEDISAQIEATIEDARNTQNILENSGVADDDDDTNATETPGIGTTEVPGTVTGNVQEKESNNSGSVSNIFDWAKDAISGAKDSVTNVVENVTVSTEELVQKVENSLNHFIEAVAVMIITSCVIPMLVLLLFFWMVKIVLDVDLSGAKIKGMLPERRE